MEIERPEISLFCHGSSIPTPQTSAPAVYKPSTTFHYEPLLTQVQVGSWGQMDLWNRSDSPAPLRAPSPISPLVPLSPPPRRERRSTSSVSSRSDQDGKGNYTRSSSVPPTANRRRTVVSTKESTKSEMEGHPRPRPRSLHVHDNHRFNLSNTEVPPVPVSFILAEAEAQANMSAMLNRMHAAYGHKLDTQECNAEHVNHPERLSSVRKWSSKTSLDDCFSETCPKAINASPSIQDAADNAANGLPSRRRRTLRRKHKHKDQVLISLAQNNQNFDLERQQNIHETLQSDNSSPLPKSTHRVRSGFAGVLSSPIRSLMALTLPSGASRLSGSAR